LPSTRPDMNVLPVMLSTFRPNAGKRSPPALRGLVAQVRSKRSGAAPARRHWSDIGASAPPSAGGRIDRRRSTPGPQCPPGVHLRWLTRAWRPRPGSLAL